jgi:hypothetical protein
MRSERSRLYGSRPAAERRIATVSVATQVPLGVRGSSARVEEDEPGGVDRPYRSVVQVGVQRVSELVGGHDVEVVVAHERGGAGDRIEGPLDLGPDALRGLTATRPRRGWVCGASEVKEVSAFGVVELERAGERAQDTLGDPIHVAALEAGVVRDADPGQDGDLLAAQSRNATRAIRGQPDLVRGDPRPAGGQELADLAPGVHNSRVDPPARGWETLSAPLSTRTLTSRDPVLSWSRPACCTTKEPRCHEAHFTRRT